MPHMAASSVRATLPVLGAGRMTAKGKSLPQRARPQQGHLPAGGARARWSIPYAGNGFRAGAGEGPGVKIVARGRGRGRGGGSFGQLAQEVDHLDGGEGGLGALVAGLGPGPVDRLLQRVT